MSRLLKTIGLFCRIMSLLQGSFAKETYNFKEPTKRSHRIVVITENGSTVDLLDLLSLRVRREKGTADGNEVERAREEISESEKKMDSIALKTERVNGARERVNSAEKS